MTDLISPGAPCHRLLPSTVLCLLLVTITTHHSHHHRHRQSRVRTYTSVLQEPRPHTRTRWCNLSLSSHVDCSVVSSYMLYLYLVRSATVLQCYLLLLYLLKLLVRSVRVLLHTNLQSLLKVVLYFWPVQT